MGVRSSDLRLNPHFHTLFLDGVYAPPPQSEASDAAPSAPLFQAAPKPTQADIEFVVQRVHKRILRYLEKQGVVTFAAAPGDGEVNAVLGEGFGESDPAHSTLLHTATSGSPPAGPAEKRAPVRMLREADTDPEPKGYLCAQIGAFNLHAARCFIGRRMWRPTINKVGKCCAGTSCARRWRMNGCTCSRTGT